MRIALFCHSIRSDWNHGNAHFLRGIVRELMLDGHDVHAFEPRDSWSVRQLVAEQGLAALGGFHAYYPNLSSCPYAPETLDLDRALEGTHLVLVHAWNDPQLVARIGAWRSRNPSSRVLFHDTHHRSVTRPDELRMYDLREYDGVLAFGERVRQEYLHYGWTNRAWTWREAADTRLFRPLHAEKSCDVVWIGAWGDGDRTAEIEEFLLGPVSRSGARTRVFGARYPPEARERLSEAGIEYGGWLPNYEVPAAFAAARVTVHIPRLTCVEALPEIPTIRPFEAMACGIPLISAPWDDAEGLFRTGTDYLTAASGAEMEVHLRTLLNDPEAASEIASNGLHTILERHTCAHRMRELMVIAAEIGLPAVITDPAGVIA